jgi:hypothetical protein
VSDLERRHDGPPSDGETAKVTRPVKVESAETARPTQAHAPEIETTANADNLSREQLTHPANAARLAGLLGRLQQSHGNAYVQRFVAEVGGRESGDTEHVRPDEAEHVRPGGGQPLDAGTKAHMESSFGEDFGDVRVHMDGRAAEAAGGLGARALTHGHDLFFDTGEYDPSTHEGERLLAHELAHVVQQRGGAAGAREVGRAGDAFEREADDAAHAVVSGERAHVNLRGSPPAYQRDAKTGATQTPPAAKGPTIQMHPGVISTETTPRVINVPGQFVITFLYFAEGYLGDHLPLILLVPGGVAVQVNALASGRDVGSFNVNGNLDSAKERPVTINYNRSGQRIGVQVQVIFTKGHFNYIVIFDFPPPRAALSAPPTAAPRKP